MTKRRRDYTATGFGIATSLVTALALIDFDNINWTSANDWVKLLVVCIPAIQGHVTTMKKTGEEQ